MIAALMAYGAIATGLLLLAGMALERATPPGTIPRRFIWCGLIVLSCGLTAVAGRSLLAPDRVISSVTGSIAPSDGMRAASAPTSPGPSLRKSLDNVVEALRWPVARAARAGISTMTLLASWGLASAVLLAIGIGTTARNRRLRRRWQVVEMEGRKVRLSQKTGPAVLGTLRPEIVVPGWLLSSSAEERRLALLHESEHLRARDGALLAAGWAVVTVLPWNLPLWWMVLRLRLAIEIDCDSRVLSLGAERRSYGSMLIDVSRHPSGFTVASPGLVGFPSNLERRLIAMTARASSYSRARGCFGLLVGSAALMAACGTDLPTAAEIEAMDAVAFAERAREMGIYVTSYQIDGEPATAGMAAALPAGSIASVDVTREGPSEEGAAGGIHVYTRNYGAPSYVIDGRQATADDFSALTPDRVESIVVQRAPSSETDGFRATGGTIVVTTRTVSLQDGASRGDGARTASVGVDLGGGDWLRVDADLEAQVAGPVIRDEPEGGYSLYFGDPVESATTSPPPGAIPLRNMGEPLYVIDDVAASPEAFNRLSPGDIESISVLKGAGASVYGDPQAQNGVILIRTKVR